ncbi:hypothetical protein Q5O24_02035 [Eubacteriaceae bacterium ES3]|nr:hypothetical protein Q5O24_02035 [Eubacteriaceae bacterium ES3]
MSYRIFEEFPFSYDMETLDKELHLRGNEAMLDILEELYETVKRITRPKAIYFEAKITEKTEDYVKIDDVKFESQLLHGYVEEGDTVFPYIVTAGTEIDEFYQGLKDSMELFLIDEVMNLLVNTGKVFVFKQVQAETAWPRIQDYVPGNGEEWSTEEQSRLFEMFEGQTKKIGVSLGENFFVLPGRSTIGVVSLKK